MRWLAILLLFLSISNLAMAAPIARYRFEDNLNDTTAAHNITISSSVTYSTIAAEGGKSVLVNNAMSFTFPNTLTSALNGATAWTISFWLYATQIAGQLVFWQTPLNTNFLIGVTSSFGVQIYTNAAATNTRLNQLNAWTHVAITFDGTNVKHYMNGYNVSTTNQGASGNFPNIPVLIAGSTYGGATGQYIDDLRFYTTTETDFETAPDTTPALGGQTRTINMQGHSICRGYSTCGSSRGNGARGYMYDLSVKAGNPFNFVGATSNGVSPPSKTDGVDSQQTTALLANLTTKVNNAFSGYTLGSNTIVVLGPCGINDSSTVTVKANLDAAINSITAISTKIPILLASDILWTGHDISALVGAEYNSYSEALAAGKNVYWVSLTNTAKTLCDGLHPGNEPTGYDIMGAELYSAITSIPQTANQTPRNMRIRGSLPLFIGGPWW